MTTPNPDIRRANEALNRATAARPDDLAHPSYNELEAYVDGQLDDVAREIVATHVDDCRPCAEDLSDLTAMKASLPEPSSTTTSTAPISEPNPWKRIAQIAAVLVAIAGVSLLVRRQLTETPASPERNVAQGAATTPSAPNVASAPNDQMTADERAIVDRAVASGRVELPASVRGLSAPVGTLLGSAAKAAPLVPLTPMGTAVLSTTPVFSWRGVTDAQGYTVAVFDGQFNEVARSERVTGTSWTPSAPLPRGAALAWQVTAHLGTRDILAPEPPQPEARFLVVDAATAKTLAEQQTRLKDQPLVLGVLFMQAGLVTDATREWTRAAAQVDTADRANTFLANLKQR